MFTLTEETQDPIVTVAVPKGIEVELFQEESFNKYGYKEVTYSVQVTNILKDVADECFNLKAIRDIFNEYLVNIVKDSNFDGGLSIHEDPQEKYSDSKKYTIFKANNKKHRFYSRQEFLSFLEND